MAEAGNGDKRNVLLLGGDGLQNRLLAGLIEERIGCACRVRSSDDLGELVPGANPLALLDIDALSAKQIVERLQRLALRGAASIALMNADQELDLERITASPGIKGVFFRRSSPEDLVRGIQAIFNGECWLPRKILSARWEQTTRSRVSEAADVVHLSRKETETLILLARGNSNGHIARKLNVSTHTVKSHVYKLFRKLQVSNRVQAVRWALQHLDGLEKDPT